jgi:5-methylcytosine-specific restriction enzyme subunit McrC
MTHSIYEYGKAIHVPNRADFEGFLTTVRAAFDNAQKRESENSRQNFLSFDGNLVSAKNYCGFIQTPDFKIDIWPKVFDSLPPSNENKAIYIQHILYWLSYCTKWKFPFLKNNLNSIQISDFPEIIINLMASEILKTISEQPIALYEDVQQSLKIPKGKINFQRYLSKGFISGNHHILECDYAPFQFDNSLNRIIKYVSRILEGQARHDDTIYKLRETLFILDEVTDSPCSVYDLDKIRLNSHYSDYDHIVEICRIILNNLFYSSGEYEQQHWCLLLPMEAIFEDFIAGFIRENFREWKVEYQKSNKYLAENPNAFQMQHDIYLTKGNTQIIVDTKYKKRQRTEIDSAKKGVVQSDMYQMLSYAYRRGCNNVLMLYPNISDTNNSHTFTIRSGFHASNEEINVTVADIPIWSMTKYSKKELDVSLYSAIQGLLQQYTQ